MVYYVEHCTWLGRWHEACYSRYPAILQNKEMQHIRSRAGSFTFVIGKHRANLAAESALSLPRIFIWLAMNNADALCSGLLQKDKKPDMGAQCFTKINTIWILLHFQVAAVNLNLIKSRMCHTSKWTYQLCTTHKDTSLSDTNLFSFEFLNAVIHVSNFTINAMYVLNQFIPRVPDLVLKSIIYRQCRRNCFHLWFVCRRRHLLTLRMDSCQSQQSN